MEHAEPAHTHPGEGCIREIDRVVHVAVFQIIEKLGGGHFRTPFLALRCRSPDMRQGNHIRRFQNGLVREVRHIFRHLAGIQRIGHGKVVHHFRPALVHDADADFHLCKGFRIEHVVG